MNKYFSTLVLTLVLSHGVDAQTDRNFSIRAVSGIASGWWIYTLGTGAGIDRTDNEPKVSFEAELIYNLKHFQIGAGAGYSFLNDNTMEEFEDTPAHRQTYSIADKAVNFREYYLLAGYQVYTSKKYHLSPQVKVGGFGIDTTHPKKDDFGSKIFYELCLANEMTLCEKLNLLVRPFYQEMMISVKNETLPGEKHRIFSLGVALGLSYFP